MHLVDDGVPQLAKFRTRCLDEERRPQCGLSVTCAGLNNAFPRPRKGQSTMNIVTHRDPSIAGMMTMSTNIANIRGHCRAPSRPAKLRGTVLQAQENLAPAPSREAPYSCVCLGAADRDGNDQRVDVEALTLTTRRLWLDTRELFLS